MLHVSEAQGLGNFTDGQMGLHQQLGHLVRMYAPDLIQH